MIKISLRTAVLAALVCGMAAAVCVMAQQPQNPAFVPWNQCCGMSPWSMEPGRTARGMMGQGMMGSGYGSMPRMHFGMISRVPKPYNSLSNPLPRTRQTVQRGAAVYEQNCASCHGATDAGDGPVGRTLSPSPANLAIFAQMPIAQWDPFMYWTVAEGGAQFNSAMPAFKSTLSKDDIWAVIAYIQSRLPRTAAQQ
jgi:mono/diheme cytochrome c family protein